MVDPDELERKFLEIMNAPELPFPAGPSQEKIEQAFSNLDTKGKQILAKLLREGVLTTEELERQVKTAKHNAEVERKRELKKERRRKNVEDRD